MPLSWFEDPDTYRVDLRPGPGEKAGQITDAYAQWVLRHGAQFNLTEEFKGPGGNPSDFDFLVAYSSLAKARGLVVPSGTGAGGGAVLDGLFLGRLPVRADTVAPGLQADLLDGEAEDEAEALELPEGVDPSKLVIIGVIDDAIQIAHERFRDGQGHTRVDAAWIQDGAFPAGGQVGRSLYRQFGRVWSRSGINQAIAQFGPDEDAIMQALDLLARPGEPYRPTPLKGLASHGTHVADVAAGYPASANAVHRRIMAVQLPIYVTQDTSGASLPAAVIAAGDFIYDHARALSRAAGVPIPVMLNFSFGTRAGQRKGTDVIERAMQAQADAYHAAMKKRFGTSPPVVNVLPAGNGNVDRFHARSAPVSAGQASLEMNLRLQPDDQTSSYLEIWMPEGTTDVTLKLSTSDGLTQAFDFALPSGAVDPGPVTLANDFVLAQASGALDDSTIVARVSVDCPGAYPASKPMANDHGWRVLVAIAPTGALVPGRPVAPAGVWSLSCTAQGATDGAIEAWVQRDTEALGFSLRGRQAYLEDTAYDAHLFDKMGDIAVANQVASPVTRNGTVSGLSTRPDPVSDGAQKVSIGAQRWDIEGASLYSAAGYAPQNIPHALASADTSRLLPGILGAANRGEARLPANGTSNAAPQVARMLGDVAEGMAVSDYPGFSAVTILAQRANPAIRPTPEHPELASNNVVREERVSLGLLPTPPDLARDVARDSVRK